MRQPHTAGRTASGWTSRGNKHVMDATIDQPLSATAAPKKPAASIDDYRRRVDELGHIILAYSDATERLQQSQAELSARVAHLQDELSEKNRLLERKNRLAA